MTTFNPFYEKPMPIEKSILNWNEMYSRSYNKYTTDAFTKCRIILMNGTEFEAQWFSRNFSRHCSNNDIRRELALIRRVEQQQQKRISLLKPADETILEHTIGYEQLAVDLTAALAKQERNCNVKNALNFALLEDFDHLYRYSNLLNLEYNVYPERLVGGYTEIMPARPTISEHRHPFDSIYHDVNNDKVDLLTKLNINIITGAEQQTMNYYMNVAPLYCKSDLGRKLYMEIGMIEEEHVSQYESLKDTSATWLEDLLLHEYTECYLYYSCMMTETDRAIRHIFEECLEQEISHLHKANEMLEKYEKKNWQEVLGSGDLPDILRLGSNIDYVRQIIKTTAGNTQKKECIVPLDELKPDARFFQYQDTVNDPVGCVPSHQIIETYIADRGQDYRFEVRPNPIRELRNRTWDNTSLGRIQSQTPEEYSVCGTTENNCRCRMFTGNESVRF